MTAKILNICLFALLLWALWRRISPAMRSEIDRSIKIAALVLVAGAAVALVAHIY
ncbi:MAG: protein MIGRI [Iodobacter sp.]